MKNRRVLALGLVIVLGVSITGCSSKKQTEETAEKVNVEVQPPGSGEVALDTDYIGTVSPEQQVYVTPLRIGNGDAGELRCGRYCAGRRCPV